MAGLLLVGLWTAFAQVSVEVVFEDDQYLANEQTRAGVRITNFSGQTLKLGEEPEWLDINVEAEQGFIISRTTDPPVVEAFELPSSSRATRWVDLVPYFNLGKAGRYKVTATVRIPELNLDLTSRPATLNITSGAKIWEQDFGVKITGTDGETSSEVRRYALVQAMNSKRVSLYARVSDSHDTRVYRVFALGPVIAFSHPEAQVDRSALLHVLFQVGARRFTYAVVNPQGELVGHQTHQYTDSRPALHARDDGTVVVSGGIRIISPDDIPKTEEKSNEPSLGEALTNKPPVVTPPVAPATNTTTKAKSDKSGKKASSSNPSGK